MKLLILGALDALDKPTVDVELLGELGELFATVSREVSELVRVALEDEVAGLDQDPGVD